MNHYVYIHFTKDNLTPFYIGKGSGDRITKTTGRNRYWKRIVNKHGFVPDYLEYFDTHEEALAYEMEMIAFFRNEGFTLCNMTDGGEGSLGHKMPETTREAIRIANMGNKYRLGIPISEIAKEKLSKANKGRKIRSKTEAEKKVLSDLSKGNRNKAIPSFCSDLIIYLSDAKRKDVAKFIGVSTETVRRYTNDHHNHIQLT